MHRTRSAAALLAALILLFSAAFAEESGLEVEEISIETLQEDPQAEAEETAVPEVFTPSHGSPWDHDLGSSYWTTPMDIADEEAVWAMLMAPTSLALTPLRPSLAK